MLTGICGGAGKYFGIDPVIVRAVVIIVAVLTGILPSVLLTIFHILVIPKKIKVRLMLSSFATTRTMRRNSVSKRKERFIQNVWEYYREHGRHHLAWRHTSDPYHILVSEVMCQQTQVDRVSSKYVAFLEKFPTIHTLADASLAEVLRSWQGLGYNRRAKMLHTCAQKVVDTYGAQIPRDEERLKTLPGIGPYTAAALLVFAYNEPVPLIETNIRSAYLYHFYTQATGIEDKTLLQLIGKTMDREQPRAWFSALMDYGAHIKKVFGNQNTRSKMYTRQSQFAGSDRQIRGAILRTLSESQKTRASLFRSLPFEKGRLSLQLKRLQEEGMIEHPRDTYRLPR